MNCSILENKRLLHKTNFIGLCNNLLSFAWYSLFDYFCEARCRYSFSPKVINTNKISFCDNPMVSASCWVMKSKSSGKDKAICFSSGIIPFVCVK